MSQTFYLVCHQTRKRIWIGQGWGKMTAFYSGDPRTMRALHRFLAEHEDRPLYLLCSDTHEEIVAYSREEEARPRKRRKM